MAKLFVVNATGQDMVVNFRTEFTVNDRGERTTERNRPYKSITVPARKQVLFGGDLVIEHIHKIIRQIERSCNAVPMQEIRTAKARGPVRMIYNIDREIPRAILKDVVQHNLAALTELGEERRRRLAVGASFTMGQLSDPTATVANTEVEFESVGDTSDSDLASSSLAEGFTEAKPSRSRTRSRR